MENFEQGTRKVIKISRKKVIISVIVVVLILLVLGFSYMPDTNRNRPFGINDGGGAESALPTVSVPTTAPGIIAEDGNYQKGYDMMTVPPDYYGGQPTINDTREFLKTNYSAQIQTRDVSGVVRDVKNAVAGADGRVDSINSSEKYGYINFVVAKSKFDSFKEEIESLVHKKLYTENVSSENLLGQKQGIEEQANSITKSLADLEKSKKDLDARHSVTLKSLASDLSSVQIQLATLRLEIANTTDNAQLTILRNQELTLIQRESTIKQNQNTENKNYANQSANLTSQIKQMNDNLANNIKQDVQFADNIETVSGYISVNWISYWQMAKLFSPIHPTIIVIVIILGILYALKRKKVLPKIELV